MTFRLSGLGPTFMGAYPGVVQGASFWCGYHYLAQWHVESQAKRERATLI